ncbi:hypothetical protein JCM15519_17900 [Fundidesulfovibrio butyratiphilus]
MNSRPNRLVVFNADDLGLSASVTESVLHAMEDGLVTDASLLACGEAFDLAVDGLRRLGKGVGAHLTAVDREKPLVDHGSGGRLTGPDGCFLTNRNALFVRLAAAPQTVLAQLRAEWRAQVERIAATGLPITHLDSHQHLHLFPGLRELVLDLAREYSIPFVRLPRFHRISPQRPVSLAVNLLSARLSRALDRAGLGRVDFAGLEDSGRQDAKKLVLAVERRPGRALELAFHPGRADQSTRTKYRHWNFHWDQELAALRDPAFREAMERLHVTAVSFADLAERSGGVAF